MSLVYPGLPVGVVIDYSGPVVPSLWLECQAQSLLRASYVALFNALCANKGTFTVTIAAPGVFTSVAHGLKVGDAVFLETTGALPTGLTADTTYYVNTVPTADTFTLGTGRTVPVQASITGAGQITTSVSQSGVHTLFHAPLGVADSTHFTLPSFGGNTIIGQTVNAAGFSAVLGAQQGENNHTLLTAELAAHTHGQANGSDFLDDHTPGGAAFMAAAGAFGPFNISAATASTGSGTAHNIVQLSIITKKIIYAGI